MPDAFFIADHPNSTAGATAVVVAAVDRRI
jgi:hypothetical protein